MFIRVAESEFTRYIYEDKRDGGSYTLKKYS